MKNKLIAFVVTVVTMITLPLSVRCAAPSMADILPPDSLGYAELAEMEVFYYLISEVGQAAVKSLEEEEAAPEDVKVKARAMLEAFNEIKPLLPRSGSLGVVSVDPRTGHPSLVFVSELSEAMAPLLRAANKLLAAVPNVKVRKTEYGTELVIPDNPMPPVAYAVRDNVLYAAMGEGLLDRVLSRVAEGALSQTAHFKEVNAATGKNAFVMAYLNVDAIQTKVLPALPPQAREVAEVLGVKDVHAAGFSLSADWEKVGSNFALQYTQDAPGIPSLLSVPNTTPKGIAYVPDDFFYVTRWSMGPPDQLLKKVCDLLAKFGAGQKVSEAFAGIKEEMGIDVEKVLASLGGEFTIGIKAPENPQVPIVLACIEARDPAYLTETVKKLLAGEEAPASVTEMEVAGRKTLMLTPRVPFPVNPVIAVDGDMLVIGTSNAVLQTAFAAKENGRNIASKPSFKTAMEGLPAASNVALEYIEMQTVGQLLLAGAGVAAESAPEHVRPIIGGAMPYIREAVQNLEEAVEVVYRTPNGLVVQSRWGTRSIMQVLRNGAAFAVKGALHFARQRAIEPVEEETTETSSVEQE